MIDDYTGKLKLTVAQYGLGCISNASSQVFDCSPAGVGPWPDYTGLTILASYSLLALHGTYTCHQCKKYAHWKHMVLPYWVC